LDYYGLKPKIAKGNNFIKDFQSKFAYQFSFFVGFYCKRYLNVYLRILFEYIARIHLDNHCSIIPLAPTVLNIQPKVMQKRMISAMFPKTNQSFLNFQSTVVSDAKIEVELPGLSKVSTNRYVQIF